MREQVRGWEGPLFLLFAVPLSRELYVVPVGPHSERFADANVRKERAGQTGNLCSTLHGLTIH